MKFCEKCGKELNDTADFCSFCGTKVTSKIENKKVEELLNKQKCDSVITNIYNSICDLNKNKVLFLTNLLSTILSMVFLLTHTFGGCVRYSDTGLSLFHANEVVLFIAQIPGINLSISNQTSLISVIVLIIIIGIVAYLLSIIMILLPISLKKPLKSYHLLASKITTISFLAIFILFLFTGFALRLNFIYTHFNLNITGWLFLADTIIAISTSFLLSKRINKQK